MRLLQGDLQAVFDALYELGVIEPILKKDWQSRLLEMEEGSPELTAAVRIANANRGNRLGLTSELKKLDQHSLEILAMEVAREYAGYHTRSELH